MKAGKLYHSFAFEKRVEVSDGRGNTIGDWLEQFRCRAGRDIMRGGETVMAARLEGRQAVIVTVRASSRTRMVNSDWRARDARTGETYNIRTVQPSERRDHIEFFCEAGVANG